jgi:hypothetical protein
MFELIGRDYSLESHAHALTQSPRRLFWGIGVKATPQAVYLANTTFFQETLATKIPGLIIYIVYQPISASWIKAAVSAGGDAFALNPANGPLLGNFLNDLVQD